MWTRIGLVLGLLIWGAAPAFADGFVETSGTYSEGAQLRGFRFDVNGALKVTQATLTSCEDQTNNLCMVSGGAVRFSYLGTAVTTDTTSASVTLPTGPKSVYAVLTGTGAITQTIKIYSGVATGFTPSTEGILLCTLTLSGTTTVADQCPVITAPGLFYKQVTSSTSGTSASSTTVVQY